jgi:hypothetical protein
MNVHHGLGHGAQLECWGYQKPEVGTWRQLKQRRRGEASMMMIRFKVLSSLGKWVVEVCALCCVCGEKTMVLIAIDMEPAERDQCQSES